ncbi:MAG: GAF domain-containing protein [Coleofasciculaceae cyanobacterium RL_1_1]|nr:GAF domain-containing protein [Coleofasciculaceae cyanobacterium RL_1_1]
MRSNLIVPITLNLASEMGHLMTPDAVEHGTGERLWGLLIAHQCDRPRRWQNREIQLLSQLSGQIAIALRQIELDAQIKSQARRERMLRHTIAQIRSSFDLMAILQTAATSIRELLGSSRVTVYRFRDDLDGDVVVESVAQQSWSILNRQIRDNCFTKPSAEKYLTGEVRSIDDIFNAPKLDECHRDFLLDLEVKAYAIAPLIIRPQPRAEDQRTCPDPEEPPLVMRDEGLKLWGLAIVHECVSSRSWQPEDLSLLRQVADQMSIAIQQTRLYDRARARARRERALRQSIAQIRSSLDLPASLQAAADSVQSVLEADRVTIYQFDDHWNGRVVVESVSRPQWSVLNQDVSDNCFKRDYAQRYCEGRVRTICDIESDTGLDDCHRQFLAQLPTRASAIVGVVLNINCDGQQADEQKHAWLWGLLIVHQCETPRRWTQGETDLLRQIADQVAIAIQQSTLYDRTRVQAEELQATLDQLRNTQEQLLRSEKLSSLGKMAGGVAHEINNANNFIFANLHHARSYVEDLILALEQADGETAIEIKNEIDFPYIQEDFPKLLASIESGSKRIKNIVDALQQFNNSDRTELQIIRLSDCLEGCLNDRRSRLTQIRVTKIFQPLPCVECNPAQIERAFGSILDNAIDAIEAKPNTNPTSHATNQDGEIIITLNDYDGWIELSITDNGIGIPDSVRPRIFDPFFTTKDVGGGTGLGLTTAYQIVVEGHGGRIDAETTAEHGTTIMVSLPVSQK